MASIPTQTILENGSTNVPLTLIDSSTSVSNLIVTAVQSSGGTPLTITKQGENTPSGVTNLVIVPAPNYPSIIQRVNSTNVVTVTVSDNNGASVTTNITVIVQYIPQPPVIVSATTNNLVILENGSAQITFTVSNVDSILFATNVSLISTNPEFVTNSGIVTTTPLPSPLAAGTSGSVTYTITPLANIFGTNQGGLVFAVGNTNHLTAATNINLSISHVVQSPHIDAFFGGSYPIYPGTATTNINYSVSTLESNATLTITASSSNPSVVPNSPNNIIIGANQPFSGVAPARYSGTIQIIIPSVVSAGSSTIYVTNTQVVAGTTNSAVASFNITVLASPTTIFANGAPIANVATNRVALPYPSANPVSGLVGSVYSVAVTLNALSATVPNDVSILLQAPNGGK